MWRQRQFQGHMRACTVHARTHAFTHGAIDTLTFCIARTRAAAFLFDDLVHQLAFLLVDEQEFSLVGV